MTTGLICTDSGFGCTGLTTTTRAQPATINRCLAAASLTMTDHWAGLRRSSPALAPSALPSILFRPLTTLGLALETVLLPITIPYWSLKHLIFGRPFPAFTWWKRISTRWHVLRSEIQSYLIPPNEGEDWKIMKEAKGYHEAVRIGELNIAVVRLPPVPESMRRGVAVCAGVKGEERPGFMLTPPGKGLETAREGERIILHVHGGWATSN